MELPRAFEKTHFSVVSAQVDRFEQLLRDNGIRIRNGSQLEHGCLLLKQLLDDHHSALRGERIASTPEFRDELQIALGVLNIIQLVLERISHPDFHALLLHLRLLGDGNVAQTRASPPRDQVGNKLFELRLALACMHSGTEVRLDDPIASSNGANPDILCRLRDRRRWGFACKVVHGDSPMSLFERLLEGVDQIERSEADVGMVIVSMKNKLPHDSLLPVLPGVAGQDPSYGALSDWEIARQALSLEFRNRVAAMVAHVGQDEIIETFRNKKALPCISSPLETVAIISTADGRLPSFCSYLHSDKIEPEGPTRFDPMVLGVLKDINSGLVPGRPLE